MARGRGKDVFLDSLRRRAEARLEEDKHRQGAARGPTSSDDPLRLLHELQVHQVELEMQNDELIRIQHQLEDSRDRYQELYDHAPVGYLTMDPMGTIVEANLSAAALLGVDRLRLLGRKLSTFMSIADGDTFHVYRQSLFESDKKMSCEVELHSENGQVVYVRLDSVAVASRRGERTLCRTVLVDITELRAAQEGLRAHESRTRTLLDTVEDAIIGADEFGRIETFNRAAERMFGYSQRDVMGRRFGMLMGTDSSETRAVAGGPDDDGSGLAVGRREAVGRKMDGGHFPLELGVGEWWHQGQRKLTVIIRDISERKQAEKQLQDSEARFRQIAEHIEDVFYVRERDGGVSYVSPAYQELWGNAAPDLQSGGVPWMDAVHDSDRERVARACQGVLEGELMDEEYRIYRPVGAFGWIRERAFPVRDENGRVSRVIGILQDITTERELEEELRQAQKMEAVGTLASGIAHDFRNLLQGIMGFVYMALQEEGVPEQAGQYMQQVMDAARRGSRMTNQLMAFSHKQPANPRQIELDRSIKDTVALLERLVGEHIPIMIEAGAPRCAIMADPVHLEQILMNLAANARDAMPEGGTLQIRTREVVLGKREVQGRQLKRVGEYVRVEVVDQGTGMDEHTRRRIFEPFFTTKGLGKGTGLGLSTVFNIVRGLGGHIEVDSAPDRGATFILYLPCCERDESGGVQAPGVWPRLRGTVLLVEDEPLVRVAVRHYLESLGLDVVEADGADAALSICDAGPPQLDILMSDVMMPGMTGARLARRMRQRYADLRVLYMSAHARSDLIQGGIIESDARMIQKPFDKHTLALELQKLIGQGDDDGDGG